MRSSARPGPPRAQRLGRAGVGRRRTPVVNTQALANASGAAVRALRRSIPHDLARRGYNWSNDGRSRERCVRGGSSRSARRSRSSTDSCARRPSRRRSRGEVATSTSADAKRFVVRGPALARQPAGRGARNRALGARRCGSRPRAEGDSGAYRAGIATILDVLTHRPRWCRQTRVRKRALTYQIPGSLEALLTRPMRTEHDVDRPPRRLEPLYVVCGASSCSSGAWSRS